MDISGSALLKHFSYDFQRGERLGIVGHNGAGKTTCLNALQGLLPLTSGTVHKGETVVIGHYEQEGIVLPPDQRVLDFVREAVAESDDGEGAEAHERRASQLLRQFNFPQSRWAQRVERLSGGERRRLQLLQVPCPHPLPASFLP